MRADLLSLVLGSAPNDLSGVLLGEPEKAKGYRFPSGPTCQLDLAMMDTGPYLLFPKPHKALLICRLYFLGTVAGP